MSLVLFACLLACGAAQQKQPESSPNPTPSAAPQPQATYTPGEVETVPVPNPQTPAAANATELHGHYQAKVADARRQFERRAATDIPSGTPAARVYSTVPCPDVVWIWTGPRNEALGQMEERDYGVRVSAVQAMCRELRGVDAGI